MNSSYDLIASVQPAEELRAQARQELRQCNALSRPYGLQLSEEDILELVEAREQALNDSGRLEFGGGVLPRLLRAIVSSPWLEQDGYATTLAELQEAFYYYKSEAQDFYSDEELIEFICRAFNGPAQGSADYVRSTSLDELSRRAREGKL